jgi:hypothetical protein
MRKARFLILISALLTSLLPANSTNAAVTGAPSAPQNITQSANTTGVTLNWSAPASVGGGVTSYRIEYSTNGTSWTMADAVSSSTFTYTVGGLTPSTTYYFRVAAYATNTRGANGYPWTKIYGTTAKNRNSSGLVDYEAGYGIAAGDTSTTVSGTFTRVRYRLDTTINAVTNFADVDFDKWVRGNTDTATTNSQWDPSIAALRIPNPNSPSAYTIHANVTDLNVYSDNSAVSNGYGMTGRLEIWPWDYTLSLSGLKPVGVTGVYDYDDLPTMAASYASFQVHDLDNLKPVFVWNHQDYNVNAEIAYGKNTGTNPDWTFCYLGGGYGSCPVPTTFRLQIYVNSPITTVANLVTTASVSVSANPIYRTSTTISYSTTTPGKVTFYEAGRVITGCKNILVTSAASCNWKPSRRNAITVSARLTPANGALSVNTASTSVFILKRSGSR